MSVAEWVEGFADTGRKSRQSMIGEFDRWLKGKGFSSLDVAVRFQKEATGDDRYRLGDLAVQFVKGKGGTYNSMIWRYATVRSFFYCARAELPRVRVQFTPTKDATVGMLDMEVFRVLVRSAGLRDQAIYLTLFQGLMDQHRFFTVFNKMGGELAEHIREKGVDVPFRVNVLKGRKTRPRPFTTWIGRDALTAWKLYFERERGWPKSGEAAALDQFGKPFTEEGLYKTHMRRLERLKYVKRNHSIFARYGYGLHELRDLARSTLEKAKEQKFNVSSAEHWMGHMVDPLFYNKIWKLDPEYNLTQYKIAEKYLNIISTPPGTISEKEQNQLRGLMQEMEELKRDLLEVRETRRMEQRQHTLVEIDSSD